MKVKDVIEKLQTVSGEHEVLLYLDKDFCQEMATEEHNEYELWSIKMEDEKEGGWDGLMCIRPDDMVGNG